MFISIWSVRTLTTSSFFLAAAWLLMPEQSLTIFVIGLLSGSRNQYRFRQVLQFGSLCFGRWSRILVTPWAPGCARRPKWTIFPGRGGGLWKKIESRTNHNIMIVLDRRKSLSYRLQNLISAFKEGAMKKEQMTETKKAKYEKPVLTKFKKLTDVVAGVESNFNSLPGLGCTWF